MVEEHFCICKVDPWLSKTFPPPHHGENLNLFNHNSFLFLWHLVKELLENLYIGHLLNDPQDDFSSIRIPLNYLNFFIFANGLLDGLIRRNFAELSCKYVGLKIYPLCNARIWWDGFVQDLDVMPNRSKNHVESAPIQGRNSRKRL